MFEFMCFRSSNQKLFYKIGNLWYRNRCSGKTLQKILALAKLLYSYSSAKDKLLCKYFTRKIICKNTSNSSCLLLVILNAVIRTLFCFSRLCSKELAVTLKCYYEKNSLVETTLNCLLFKFSMKKAKYFLKSDI